MPREIPGRSRPAGEGESAGRSAFLGRVRRVRHHDPEHTRSRSRCERRNDCHCRQGNAEELSHDESSKDPDWLAEADERGWKPPFLNGDSLRDRRCHRGESDSGAHAGEDPACADAERISGNRKEDPTGRDATRSQEEPRSSSSDAARDAIAQRAAERRRDQPGNRADSDDRRQSGGR